MIRPHRQSLLCVVSYLVDALVQFVGEPSKTAATRQRKLNYLQRLIYFTINVSQRLASPASKPPSKPLLPLNRDKDIIIITKEQL